MEVNYAYIANNSGMVIIDINDRANPELVSIVKTSDASFSNGGEAYGIAGNDEYLFVGDLQEGVEIWDIISPSTPQLIETDSQFAPHSLILEGEVIYLADQDKSFVALEYNNY